MLGFFPLVGVVLVWLAVADRAIYRELRTALLVSVAFATSISCCFRWRLRASSRASAWRTRSGSRDHDEGSFLGIRFNPYAADAEHARRLVAARRRRGLPCRPHARRPRVLRLAPGADGPDRHGDRQPLPARRRSRRRRRLPRAALLRGLRRRTPAAAPLRLVPDTPARPRSGSPRNCRPFISRGRERCNPAPARAGPGPDPARARLRRAPLADHRHVAGPDPGDRGFSAPSAASSSTTAPSPAPTPRRRIDLLEERFPERAGDSARIVFSSDSALTDDEGREAVAAARPPQPGDPRRHRRRRPVQRPRAAPCQRGRDTSASSRSSSTRRPTSSTNAQIEAGRGRRPRRRRGQRPSRSSSAAR